MIYLFGHIVFASAFTLALKWVQMRRREDIVSVGAINYITAALLIFPRCYSVVNASSVNSAAVATGATMGACYFTAYFFVIYLIKWVGAASSTVVGSLSILFPISVAAMLWKENPNSYQWIGIALALTSLTLIGRNKSSAGNLPADAPNGTASNDLNSVLPTQATRMTLILLGFFVIAGFSRLAQRSFGHLSTEVHRPTFLFTAFAVAGTASLLLLFVRRRWPSRGEWCIGVALGTANILHTHFLMRSLDHHPGYLVFPIASAGGLIFTTLVATLLMGEHTSRKTRLGIGMAVLALVLLNVSV